VYVLTPSENDQLVTKFEPPSGPISVNAMFLGNGDAVVKDPETRIEVVYRPVAVTYVVPTYEYVVAQARLAQNASGAQINRKNVFKYASPRCMHGF